MRLLLDHKHQTTIDSNLADDIYTKQKKNVNLPANPFQSHREILEGFIAVNPSELSILLHWCHF